MIGDSQVLLPLPFSLLEEALRQCRKTGRSQIYTWLINQIQNKAITIDFEEFNRLETISGDTFSDLGVVFERNLRIYQADLNALPQSGINVGIDANSTGGNISGFFTEAVDFISVFAGDSNLSDTETLTLLGFDEFDNLVASDTFTNIIAQTLSISGPGTTRFEILDENKTRFGIDDFTFNSKPKSTPETASILGLLAVGAMGAGSILKRK